MTPKHKIGDKIEQYTITNIIKVLNSKHSILYEAKCVCGKIKTTRLYELKRSKHCGCLKYVGIRFGDGEVIKRAGKKYRNSYWELLCSCGKSYFAPTCHLKAGLVTNCGCKKKKQIKNLSNKIYGMLTVLKHTGHTNGNNIWLCKCKCGTLIEIATKRLKNKQSCGCLLKRTGCNHPNYNGCKNITGLIFSRIKHGALRRNIYFDIDIEYIDKLLEKQQFSCAITGRVLKIQKNRNEEHTASLDRIDSSKGYIKGNVWWIHKDINRMKSNMSMEYFVNICKEVSKYELDKST